MIYTLKQIETPRLILRPVQLGDEIPLNKTINNSLEILQKWQPWAKDPSIETTRDFVQRGVFTQSLQSNSIADFPMVVIHKENKTIIGASGYNDRSNPSLGLYEICYWLDVDYQGQGLVTEYTNALTQYALHELSAKRVVIRMQVDNIKSIAVAERLNFSNEGIIDRDPRDCATDDAAKDYMYSCNSPEHLPALEVTWINNDIINNNAAIISWAKQIMGITDDKILSQSKTLIKTPWSNVLEINNGKELLYLKQTPKDLFIEADIIKLLKSKCNISMVADIMADNQELHCFLMKDAGKTLREIMKQKFDTELFCKAIHQFTSVQLAVANHIKIFLDRGVPDWRLDKLPDLYMQLLSKKEILIADGLSEKEVIELESLQPKVNDLCQKLSDYAIKPSIVQPDFNDNNTLIADNSQDITIIDLGEIVISHPFFSLLNCLQQAKKHHALTGEDNAYLQLMDACMENYKTVESKEHLLEAFTMAQTLESIYSPLAYYRLMSACDNSKLDSFYGRGKLIRPLKKFITVCRQMHK